MSHVSGLQLPFTFTFRICIFFNVSHSNFVFRDDTPLHFNSAARFEVGSSEQ